MKWIKKGLIFNTDGSKEWSRTHAQVPKPLFVSENKLRIYYGTRDEENRTYTSFIEVNPERPEEVIYIHDTPIMGLGNLGAFDEKGVMPACFITNESEIIMYYTGWADDTRFPYAVFIGAAISLDGGIIFNRISQGPIIGKQQEAISCTQPFVINENNKRKMWYSSFRKWEEKDGKKEAFYCFRYAESIDGIKWDTDNDAIFHFNKNADAVINPFVWRDTDWRMLYSYRSGFDFRKTPKNSYKIGIAVSEDGYVWENVNNEEIIGISKKGWDSEMVAYPAIYFYKGRKYLLYNGNGFGKTGFGYAVSEGG